MRGKPKPLSEEGRKQLVQGTGFRNEPPSQHNEGPDAMETTPNLSNPAVGQSPVLTVSVRTALTTLQWLGK